MYVYFYLILSLIIAKITIFSQLQFRKQRDKKINFELSTKYERGMSYLSSVVNKEGSRKISKKKNDSIQIRFNINLHRMWKRFFFFFFFLIISMIEFLNCGIFKFQCREVVFIGKYEIRYFKFEFGT